MVLQEGFDLGDALCDGVVELVARRLAARLAVNFLKGVGVLVEANRQLSNWRGSLCDWKLYGFALSATTSIRLRHANLRSKGGINLALH